MRAQKISATIAGLGLAGLLAAPLMPTAHAIPIIPGGSAGSSNTTAENTNSGTATNNKNNGTISDLDDNTDATTTGGKSITSTVTTTTTPAPRGDGTDAHVIEPAPEGAVDVTGTGVDQATNPATQPMQEELALTGNSTQVVATTLAVLALLAVGGYAVAMRRTTM